MKLSLKHLLIVPLLCLSLIAVGCTVSNLVTLLDGVAAAAAAAVPLATSELGPDGPAVAGYLNLAAANIPQAITIIENAPGGNVATVASQVISLINAIATAPQLSATVPVKDAAIINAVALSAQAFLAAFRQQTAGLHVSHPELMAAFTGTSAVGPIKLSRADKRTMKQAKARITKVLAAQQAVKKASK